MRRRLWELAHGPRPAAINPGEFHRLLGELEAFNNALARGTVRLEARGAHPGGETAA